MFWGKRETWKGAMLRGKELAEKRTRGEFAAQQDSKERKASATPPRLLCRLRGMSLLKSY